MLPSVMSDRDDEDDDVPQLSAAALAALQEFYAESEAGHSALRHSYTVGAVQEDWVSETAGASLVLLLLTQCFTSRASFY